MTATTSTISTHGIAAYDQNTAVDSTRANLLTDIQMSSDSVPMPSNVTQMALNDHTKHDMDELLSRLVNLGTYEWNSSATPIPVQLARTDYDADTANYLQKFDFPQAIFDASPLVVAKLQNYQYFKADVEFEVKINVQPFLQGALMAVHNPYISQIGDFRRKGTRYLASQTSAPHKMVSLEEANSFKLTIPYSNIYDMFDLDNSDNQFGSIFLYVLSSLRGVGVEEKANYTVFARFVNPQYYVPTHKDVISTSRNAHDIKRLESKGYRVAQSSVSPVAAPDSGESSTPGPVSKIANSITTVSDILSDVPVVGQIASTVAWISRCVGNVATTFGWSKPVSIQPKHTLKPNSALIHTEGQDDATTLSLLQDNGIDGSSFMPESKDEMALSYVLGRPNFFHAQTADTTMFSGNKLITSWEVSPFSQYQYGNSEDSQTLYLGSFAYASMLASLWRGTINFDIMVIKTTFHQGRFAVVYLPETNIADVPPTLGNLLNTTYSAVCDLKEQDGTSRTNFRVSIPYISNTPWRETYKGTTNETNPGPDATTLDTKTGCVAIYSVVDLSCPSLVAADVTFYIAHSAGEDYQLARPKMNLCPGFQGRVAQSDTGPVFVPQDENLLVPSHSPTDVTAQTTGEYFRSLRSLIKRFGMLTRISQSENYVGLRTRHMSENAISGKREMSRLNLSNPVLPTPWYMVSFLYRFYNGSSQTKIIPFTSGVTAEAYTDFDEDTVDQTTSPESKSYGQPVFTQLQQVSNAFEVRTPYYRSIRGDVVNSQLTPVLGDVRTHFRCRNLANYGGTDSASPMYEAAGDDFSFYFLVGPPPMCDIRNITAPSSFPSGTTVEVDLSGVTTATTLESELLVGIVGFDPTLAVSISNTYGIASSTQALLTITYTDTTTSEVPVLSCKVAQNSDGQLRIPINSAKTVDEVATLTSLTAVPAFTIVTDAPTT